MVQLNTNENTTPLSIVDEIYSLLEGYSQHFQQYFFDNCKGVIDYFGEAAPGQTIDSWFFDEANPSALPYKAKDAIYNIEGLSGFYSKDGFSFIRQYKLAEKLSISDRYLRGLLTPIKELGLLFSRRNKRINYKFTFDLGRSVGEYFETLVNVLFEQFSLTFNSNSETSSGSTSTTNSASSSGSQGKFSLASLYIEHFANL